MKILKIHFHDFHQLIPTKRLNILSLLQIEKGREREREEFAVPAATDESDLGLILGYLTTTKAFSHLPFFSAGFIPVNIAHQMLP